MVCLTGSEGTEGSELPCGRQFTGKIYVSTPTRPILIVFRLQYINVLSSQSGFPLRSSLSMD